MFEIHGFRKFVQLTRQPLTGARGHTPKKTAQQVLAKLQAQAECTGCWPAWGLKLAIAHVPELRNRAHLSDSKALRVEGSALAAPTIPAISCRRVIGMSFHLSPPNKVLMQACLVRRRSLLHIGLSLPNTCGIVLEWQRFPVHLPGQDKCCATTTSRTD